MLFLNHHQPGLRVVCPEAYGMSAFLQRLQFNPELDNGMLHPIPWLTVFPLLFFFFNQDEVYIFERYVSLLEASDSMLAVHTFEK